ncbi:FAD-binding protein [Klebsiella pneumoniae subsp. pneumoniae]|nr:FAD-binding protein [Klebsiella pneumoniae subsp. pneumoniae]
MVRPRSGENQDGAVVGCTALCIETGEVVYFKARATVLATGGAGRIYQSTTNAHINTGDGVGMAIPRRRAGAGYGNVAVPPDRYRRGWGSGYRRLPRRRRLPAEQTRRTLYGALCPER